MNTPNEVIELTAAELELIRIKREEEKLAKEKAEAQRLKEYEEKIALKRKYADGVLADAAKKNDFFRKAWLELNRDKNMQGLYAIGEYDKKVNISFEMEGFDKFEEEIPYKLFYIERKDTRYRVNALPRITYTSGWHSRPIDHGLHFEIEGMGYIVERRRYKTFKSVHKKIQEAVATRNRTLARENLQKYTIGFAQKALSAAFPSATVTVKEDYDYNPSRRSVSDTFIRATIQFDNGWGVRCKVYPNAEDCDNPKYGYTEIIQPSFSSDYTFLDIANKISKIKLGV